MRMTFTHVLSQSLPPPIKSIVISQLPVLLLVMLPARGSNPATIIVYWLWRAPGDNDASLSFQQNAVAAVILCFLADIQAMTPRYTRTDSIDRLNLKSMRPLAAPRAFGLG